MGQILTSDCDTTTTAFDKISPGGYSAVCEKVGTNSIRTVVGSLNFSRSFTLYDSYGYCDNPGGGEMCEYLETDFCECKPYEIETPLELDQCEEDMTSTFFSAGYEFDEDLFIFSKKITFTKQTGAVGCMVSYIYGESYTSCNTLGEHPPCYKVGALELFLKCTDLNDFIQLYIEENAYKANPKNYTTVGLSASNIGNWKRLGLSSLDLLDEGNYVTCILHKDTNLVIKGADLRNAKYNLEQGAAAYAIALPSFLVYPAGVSSFSVYAFLPSLPFIYDKVDYETKDGVIVLGPTCRECDVDHEYCEWIPAPGNGFCASINKLPFGCDCSSSESCGAFELECICEGNYCNYSFVTGYHGCTNQFNTGLTNVYSCETDSMQAFSLYAEHCFLHSICTKLEVNLCTVKHLTSSYALSTTSSCHCMSSATDYHYSTPC